MFEQLDSTERIELSRKMARAAHRLHWEYEQLAADPAARLVYQADAGDWLAAAGDCAESAWLLLSGRPA